MNLSIYEKKLLCKLPSLLQLSVRDFFKGVSEDSDLSTKTGRSFLFPAANSDISASFISVSKAFSSFADSDNISTSSFGLSVNRL